LLVLQNPTNSSLTQDIFALAIAAPALQPGSERPGYPLAAQQQHQQADVAVLKLVLQHPLAKAKHRCHFVYKHDHGSG